MDGKGSREQMLGDSLNPSTWREGGTGHVTGLRTGGT